MTHVFFSLNLKITQLVSKKRTAKTSQLNNISVNKKISKLYTETFKEYSRGFIKSAYIMLNTQT